MPTALLCLKPSILICFDELFIQKKKKTWMFCWPQSSTQEGSGVGRVILHSLVRLAECINKLQEVFL